MTRSRTLLALVLIVAGPLCGLAATDLILPAIPVLPQALDGSAAGAQWVLAAFAFGTGVGLLVFGELGGRFPVVNVLVAALFAFAALSLAAAQATSLPELAALRFAQGIAASAPAVYAPVLVKQLYSAEGAVVMLGRLGSVEAMAPAVAPIIGAWLLTRYGWTASFVLVAVVAALIGLGWLVGPGLRAAFGRSRRVDAGYATLLADARFLRYGLSQACTLGALLVIVFAAPSVITVSLGGTLSDFIVMQVLGITLFVTAANLAGVFSRWWGVDRTLVVGSGVSALGCAGLVLKASAGLTAVPVLWGLFMLVNVGLGIRGPAGFFQALQAAGDNDARGSALVILFVMLITGAGTALVAPVIEHGLLPVALVAAGISSVSVLLVLNLRSAPAG